MRTKIYALLDPVTGALCYIGKTTRTLWARLQQHVYDAKRTKRAVLTPKTEWIRALGRRPRIDLLDMVDGDGCAAEVTMIGIARSLGCALTNVSDGGEGSAHALASRVATRRGR